MFALEIFRLRHERETSEGSNNKSSHDKTNDNKADDIQPSKLKTNNSHRRKEISLATRHTMRKPRVEYR